MVGKQDEVPDSSDRANGDDSVGGWLEKQPNWQAPDKVDADDPIGSWIDEEVRAKPPKR